MPQTPVLMTQDNPEGWKLEELLKTIAAELGAKNVRLSMKFPPGEAPESAKKVIGNNQRVINRLHQALEIQQDTQTFLDGIGPDQGPTGTPRV